MFCLTLPLVCLFICTMPDVRKKGDLVLPTGHKCPYSDWFPFTFFVSIVWIGILSYFMVWWATTIGKSFGIPDEVCYHVMCDV